MDFFSFGTNDLTQTGLGFSRDDIEGRIMPLYANLGIVERSPFGTLDTRGRGRAGRDRAGAGEGDRLVVIVWRAAGVDSEGNGIQAGAPWAITSQLGASPSGCSSPPRR